MLNRPRLQTGDTPCFSNPERLPMGYRSQTANIRTSFLSKLRAATISAPAIGRGYLSMEDHAGNRRPGRHRTRIVLLLHKILWRF